MTTKNDVVRWYRRFGAHLLLVMILITRPLVGVILAVDCRQAEEALTAGDELRREQTEKSFVQSVRLVDAGLKLFDGTLESRMEKGFGPGMAEYERAGRDAGAMDLSRAPGYPPPAPRSLSSPMTSSLKSSRTCSGTL